MQTDGLRDWQILKNVNTSNFRKVFVLENRALILENEGTIAGIGSNKNYLIGVDDESFNYTKITCISRRVFKDFTTNGEHALAISEEGILYSWGSNEHGELGRDGYLSPFSEVKKVFPIGIKEAACGTGFSCVLTQDGRVLEWGIYGFNKLVLSSQNDLDKPDEEEENEEIVSIQGTKYYPMILTRSGKLLTQLKNITEKQSAIVNPCSTSEKIYKGSLVYIHSWDAMESNIKVLQACDITGINWVLHNTASVTLIEYPIIKESSFTFCATEKVFIPPFRRTKNKCNIRLHTEKANALEGPLKNKCIKQILGGKSYAFALTCNGEIFYWALLPVYTCSCQGQPEPKPIAGKFGRVIQIWAATSHDVLVAANSFGNLYSITWSGSEIVLSKINVASAGKYFAMLGMTVQGPVYDQSTMDTNMDENDALSEWRKRFEAVFNVKEGSDIAFIVGEGIIYAHRLILSIQSSYLNAILKNDWKENSEDNKVIIKEYSYSTYLRFMKFLYTGKLEMSSHEGNLELLNLAHEYIEKPLLDLCEKMVIQGLTVENAFSTYNVAHLLGLEDVRQACKSLISANLEDVIFSEDTSKEDDALLLRCMRDMVCSKNIVGEEKEG